MEQKLAISANFLEKSVEKNSKKKCEKVEKSARKIGKNNAKRSLKSAEEVKESDKLLWKIIKTLEKIASKVGKCKKLENFAKHWKICQILGKK